MNHSLMATLSEIFHSKKHLATITTVVGLISQHYLDVNLPPELIAGIIALVGALVVGQGISDAGKGKAQIEASITSDEMQDVIRQLYKRIEELEHDRN
jgi:hypothetical protein